LIRQSCKRRCYKKIFKQGNSTRLCLKCQAYLKLKNQIENARNEWDLYSTNSTLNLTSNTMLIKDFKGVVNLENWIKSLDLDIFSLRIIRGYMLYHVMKNNYSRWKLGVMGYNYSSSLDLAFSIAYLKDKKYKLSIHKTKELDEILNTN